MHLALVGTGQMGTAVEHVATDQGHDIVARFDSSTPFDEASPSALEEVDAAIDFSLPSLALAHIQQYCTWGVPAVVGTTGWYDELDSVEQWVADHEASLLYAPNFSMGVSVVRRALTGILPLLDELEAYDPFVQEVHHTKKVDSPSGTAQMLGGLLVKGLERKDHMETETQHQRIDPGAVHVTSTRAGTVFGEHTVAFDGPYDQITLGHRAKNRKGFAAGAVQAAEWLVDRQGLFSLDDMLDDLLTEPR
jgi:4-hydroxy-tetrahydrodipicolinate reductase